MRPSAPVILRDVAREEGYRRACAGGGDLYLLPGVKGTDPARGSGVLEQLRGHFFFRLLVATVK